MEFESPGPTDQDLIELEDLTSIPIHELRFPAQSQTIFIPSSRNLDTDESAIKKRVIGDPHQRWLAVSIPYYGEKTHEVALLEAFVPQQ